MIFFEYVLTLTLSSKCNEKLPSTMHNLLVISIKSQSQTNTNDERNKTKQSLRGGIKSSTFKTKTLMLYQKTMALSILKKKEKKREGVECVLP
jgi:hypothetical protein